MGNLKAIIFDVDGTLADTERYAHWPACNEAFLAQGYNIQWSWADYEWLLRNRAGTPERVKYALAQHTNLPAAEREAAAQQIAAKKRALYLDKYVADAPLRAGVAALIDQAIQHDVRLAIVTQSHEDQVEALLRRRLPAARPYFNPILGGRCGSKSDPESPLYKRCLAELEVSPRHTLAIEDSENGLKAALAAGLPCAVFYNDDTFGQNFSRAALVARSLEFFSLPRLAALCLP